MSWDSSWNNVCEDCGHEWESDHDCEDKGEKCPSCGSRGIQSSKGG